MSLFFGSFLFAKTYLYFMQVMRNSVIASQFQHSEDMRVHKNYLHRNWFLQRFLLFSTEKVCLIGGSLKVFFIG